MVSRVCIDCRWGFDLVIGFIQHLQLLTTMLTLLYIFQTTTGHTRSISLLCLHL